MRACYAREIRRGITVAKDVIARRRMRPKLTRFGTRDAPPMPLWEQAYHHEFSRAIRDGRIKPPKGRAGA